MDGVSLLLIERGPVLEVAFVENGERREEKTRHKKTALCSTAQHTLHLP